jgi:hypothetical protein
MPISETKIRDLAGFKGEDAPVTSLYLDVDGRRRIRARDYESVLDRMLRPVRERHHQDGQPSVWADTKRIEEYVKAGVDRSRVRGLAIFSCSAHGFWEVVELAVPVRDRLVINHTPYVRELEAVVARHERFAVLLADRQRARLFLFHQGELLEKQEQFDVLPRHDDDGGQLGKDQVAGHTAVAAQRHFRRAAAAAFGLYQEQGFDHLVLALPEEIAGDLERELHAYLRERIAARLHLAATARPCTRARGWPAPTPCSRLWSPGGSTRSSSPTASRRRAGVARAAPGSGRVAAGARCAARRWRRSKTWSRRRSKRRWPRPAGSPCARTTPTST